MDINKAIIPAAGLGTRFLPLTKVVPKELLPLVEQPMVSYVVKEAKEAGIEQVLFVLSPDKKQVLDYFKKQPKIETLLQDRGQKDLLAALQKQNKDFENINFSFVLQPFPRGDGEAVLRAKPKIGKNPFAVLFPDDIFAVTARRAVPLQQLKKVFSTSQKPVVGLKRVSEEKAVSYGIVAADKIAHRLFKIKDIIEKPKPGTATLYEGDGLAIAGRYILPPEILTYLAKTPPNRKGEIILAEALKLMLKDGKIIYGCEIEGEWLECGKTVDWLKSNLYLCLQHPVYGPGLKEALKEWLKKIK